MNYAEIGNQIRNKRKNLKVTQEKVAEKVGITPSLYSHIENGSRKASLSTFVKISEYFDVSLDYIIKNKKYKKDTHNKHDEQIIYLIKDLSEEQKEMVLDITNACLKHFEINTFKEKII